MDLEAFIAMAKVVVATHGNSWMESLACQPGGSHSGISGRPESPLLFQDEEELGEQEEEGLIEEEEEPTGKRKRVMTQRAKASKEQATSNKKARAAPAKGKGKTQEVEAVPAPAPVTAPMNQGAPATRPVAVREDGPPSMEVVKGLWGLVNNAGIGLPMGPNEWLTKDDFMKVINVNLMGLIDVTLKLLPLVRKAQGRIVNVSSVAGRIAICGGGYCIAKYGVQAFSDSLRRELSSFGVKVAIVEPGAFRTSLASKKILNQGLQSQWDSLPTEVKESYGQQYFDKVLQGIEVLTQKSNTDLTLVTDCIEHGLTAVYPRTRYSVGRDAKLFFIPVSYMPTVLGDYLMK